LNKGDDKWGNPGVRPIGIGEILRRLVGKLVVGHIRQDIIDAAGPLQTCAGLKAGIEASIHAMRRVYEEETTEGILLVDAENAFNNLNRQVALHNIKNYAPRFIVT
jgi:ribonuclease HI